MFDLLVFVESASEGGGVVADITVVLHALVLTLSATGVVDQDPNSMDPYFQG